MNTQQLTQKFRNNMLITGEMTVLSWQTLKACLTRPFYFHKLSEQIVALGVGSVSIALVIGLVMGSVMTLQFGYGLEKFGGTLYVPKIVSLSLIREMAPIFTSLLVAGRIGSGIAAEIGSMNVSQQVDALRALGTNPIRVLVVPRLMAAVIALPLLTCLSNFFGIIGSLFVAHTEFDMGVGFFINTILETVKFKDFTSGLLKTVVFAFIIIIIACYKGLRTKDGTKGVGSSTTWVVVVSSIWILFSDFLLNKIFLTYWLD